MVVVVSDMDDSSERIISSLSDAHGVSINAVLFSFFRDGTSELLGRAWLEDPTETIGRAESRKRAPWSGYWFVNVGEGLHRNWDDNRRCGYIAAGQGEKYSRPLTWRWRISPRRSKDLQRSVCGPLSLLTGARCLLLLQQKTQGEHQEKCWRIDSRSLPLRLAISSYSSSVLPATFSTARNASCGMSTRPTRFMRFLPSFCFSRSLRLRVMSPP